MAININGGFGAASLMRKHAEISDQKLLNDQNAQKARVDAQAAELASGLDEYSADNIEDMAEAVSQQMRRRSLDKKGIDGSEGFERVLEEDPKPKVEVILKMADLPQNSIEKLLQYAQAFFPDESDLVLILRELVKRKMLSRTQKQKLEKVLRHLEETADPKRLKAGINCALKARLDGALIQVSPKNLRNTYRDFLTSDEQGAALYQDWIKQYGFKPRLRVVDFVQASLICDMYSSDPSCSVVEFGALLEGIHNVQMLRSADETFLRELQRAELIARAATAAQFEDTQSNLLRVMLDGLQRPLDISDVLTGTLRQVTLTASSREKSELTQMVLRAFRSIPDELYFSAEARDQVLGDLRDLGEVARQLELDEMRAEKLAAARPAPAE